MSKVDSLTSEPAIGLNRRGLLAAVSGLAAAGALSAAAPALPAAAAAPTFNPSPELLEYRRIAHFLADKGTDGELLALDSPCDDNRIAAELILAVLEMAKGGAHV